MVIGKVLLQCLWQLNIGCDERVPATDWEKWRQQIHLLTGHPVPRCYYNKKAEFPFSFTVFLMPLKRYMQQLFIYECFSDTSISIALVMTKTKVAPVSRQYLDLNCVQQFYSVNFSA